MVTALLLVSAAVALYFLAAFSSYFGEVESPRSTAFSVAKAKFSSEAELSDEEAILLLEDELLEDRNNKFRNY